MSKENEAPPNHPMSPTSSPVTIAPKPCPWCSHIPYLTYPTGQETHVYHGGNGCILECKAFPLSEWNRRPSAGEDVKAALNRAVDRIGVYLHDIDGWADARARGYVFKILEQELGNHKPSPSSPVVPVLERLEAEFKDHATNFLTPTGIAMGYGRCADRIAQLIKEAKGG